ncbi:cytochrome c oxidase subunit 7B, mitochondrial isoform X1 [Sminthopsis crassicaudata]|uniref:cytochrome c oxidase subunit 7B, mitochondrial isoform X1 n=1 Tax=Sminthopsis crassicaudata TaxID=9301 RepID=UPI003D68CDDA
MFPLFRRALSRFSDGETEAQRGEVPKDLTQNNSQASASLPLTSRVRSFQQTVERQNHQDRLPNFHDKYGTPILLSGATFCLAIWAYAATQIGIEWNLSPVGRVVPKDWRSQ